VRTYVNGTLYSIFTRAKLREEAKELGMPDLLEVLMN
jgi:LisH domain-containing protein ARMC9